MSGVITLIVPPGTGGVRDYADIMASGLRAVGFDAHVFTWQKDQASEIDAYIARSDCLYLQYSGYGYANRGAPLWMLCYLQAHRASIKRLGIFFHELYAFGPPWGSAFWLSPVQSHIAGELAKLADFWVTNRSGAFDWLSQKSEKPSATLPVISNIGELNKYSPARERVAVVFGSRSRRHNTWQAAGSAIFQWAKRHDIRLHDIGQPFQNAQFDRLLDQYGVISHGMLDPRKVSEVLSTAMFGVLAYPLEYVAKSGVFAAYCAHGVAPLVIAESYNLHDDLIINRHFFSKNIFYETNFLQEKNVGSFAWQWYQSHSLPVQLQKLQALIIE